MPNKSMRILIADEHLVQVMQIEKMLNQMGYYRIAPVKSFEQLLKLIQSALEPFHLLIANTDLATHAGVDMERFCRGNPQIRHALLYETQILHIPMVPPAQRKAVNVCLPRLPDNDALKNFMDIVDAPQVLAELPLNLPRARPKSRIDRLDTVFSRR
ncbi:histidine kinase [Pseudomonas sp. R5(2019)]|uniref:histidine kinase n=1 Tax=Pseudomonas sp. R5(2019) TaxID=2697566 RepID=UPI00141342DC|nr:histidine kinase [Pseudomonas sp. R5(2019)]NBA96236.1 histidine kinase [Pseudomonas sp. R5(2019)]